VNCRQQMDDSNSQSLEGVASETLSETTKKSDAFCLFLGDLSCFCSEQEILEVFSPFGTVLDIRIIRNRETNRSLSYGFIDFATASAATSAMKELNGKLVCGRAIR
jgi:RNA recognition motif-containing protein